MDLINFNAGQNLPDGGLWYAETNPAHLIVEPYNAISAFLFVLLAFWWLNQLKGKFRERTFLYISTLILMVGAIGGSIYHAFRISAFFIYMDWLPILILCLMSTTYFLYHVLNKVGLALLITGVIVFIQIVIWNIGNTNGHNNININYGLMAASVLTPVFLFLRKKNFKNGLLIGLAVIAFLMALLFRIIDTEKWLSMGTHFLWHVFGMIACHLMFLFIYKSYTPQERDV